MSAPARGPARAGLAGWVLAASMLLVGCGGGGSSDADVAPPEPQPPNLAVQGPVEIAVTDAAGDFLVYEVGLTRIELSRADGSEVQTLPVSARVDFAELTALSELLTAAEVPAGTYTRLALDLDFSDAVVMIQDEDGVVYEAAVEDADGAQLTSTLFTIELPETDPLRVAAGVPARLTLDFDLEASNEIVSFEPALVRTDPFLVAFTEFDAERPLRVQGRLSGVADDDSVAVELRPFRRPLAGALERSFATDADTRFEFEDMTLVGPAGLEMLRAEAAGTALRVTTTPVADALALASLVVVGAAVPGSDGPALTGVVLARAGGTLTLGGVRIFGEDGADRFLRRAELLVDDTTTVVLRTADARTGEAVTTQALSIGSRVVASVVPTEDAGTEGLEQFDAGDRRVRLLRSQASAEVVTTDPLQVRLLRLEARRPRSFDFTGTGASREDDADPLAYDVDLGALDGSDLVPGSLLRLQGLVTDFGLAPPDFAADTFVALADDVIAARLQASWVEVGGTADALGDIAADRIALDVSDARARLAIAGLVDVDLPQDGMLALVPAASGGLLLTLRDPGVPGLTAHRDFAAFTTALLDGLQAGRLVDGVTVEGRYDPDDGTLTLRRMAVRWRALEQG